MVGNTVAARRGRHLQGAKASPSYSDGHGLGQDLAWRRTCSAHVFRGMKTRRAGIPRGAALCVPAVCIGEALHFGGFAWLVTLVVLMLVTSLFDREGFYGPRDPS